MTDHPPISYTTYIAAAASAHFGWGALAVTASVALGFPWWYGAIVILIIATLKETIADPYGFEKNPFWNGTLDSGAFDLSIYPVGILGGYLFLLLTHHL